MGERKQRRTQPRLSKHWLVCSPVCLPVEISRLFVRKGLVRLLWSTTPPPPPPPWPSPINNKQHLYYTTYIRRNKRRRPGGGDGKSSHQGPTPISYFLYNIYVPIYSAVRYHTNTKCHLRKLLRYSCWEFHGCLQRATNGKSYTTLDENIRTVQSWISRPQRSLHFRPEWYQMRGLWGTGDRTRKEPWLVARRTIIDMKKVTLLQLHPWSHTLFPSRLSWKNTWVQF